MYNVFAPLQDIEQAEPNIGGYCRLLIVPLQYVNNWPVIDPVSGMYLDLPDLITGKVWFHISNLPGNAVYKEDAQESDAGISYKMQLTAPLADDTTTQSLTVLTYSFNQYAVLFEEHNGMVRILGSRDAGARIMQTYTSADDEGTRQRILNIIWEHSNPAILVNSEAFSSEFSDEFG